MIGTSVEVGSFIGEVSVKHASSDIVSLMNFKETQSPGLFVNKDDDRVIKFAIPLDDHTVLVEIR